MRRLTLRCACKSDTGLQSDDARRYAIQRNAAADGPSDPTPENAPDPLNFA